MDLVTSFEDKHSGRIVNVVFDPATKDYQAHLYSSSRSHPDASYFFGNNKVFALETSLSMLRDGAGGKEQRENKVDTDKLQRNNVKQVIGDLVGVIYQANTADGKGSQYIHQFKVKNRPELVKLANGLLAIDGGSYRVTARGIED